MRLLITALAVSFVLSGIAEAESWKTTKLKPADYPPQIVAETRDTVKDGLPDGLVATAPFEMDIASAWYILPTQRYAHGVLGDTVEAGGLMAITSRGERKKTDPSTKRGFRGYRSQARRSRRRRKCGNHHDKVFGVTRRIGHRLRTAVW